jgi:hypothetical protein
MNLAWSVVLTSYSLHQNGLINLFGREAIGGNGTAAFKTAIITALLVGGVQGLYGYDEANLAVTHLSEMFGKPTTLDKIVLDTADKMDASSPGTGGLFSTGAASFAGIDLHNSVGKGTFLPGLSGGSGKAIDIVKDIHTLATEPNAQGWNTKMLAKDLGGTGAAIVMQNMGMLSQKTKDGREIAFDKNGETKVTRTPTDVLAANLGFKGLHEARVSSQNYATNRADKYYADAQKAILTSVTKELADTHGKIPKETIKKMATKYVDNQGDVNNFIAHLSSKGVDLSTDLRQELVNKNSSGSLSGAYKLQRGYTK